MTLYELYERVAETTGMEIATVESINAAVAAAYADLTSRGYREFAEEVYEKLKQEPNLVEFKIPSRLRKTLYCRVQFQKGIAIANRMSISNPKIMCKVTPQGFRSEYRYDDVIYYIKDNIATLEWNQDHYGDIVKIYYGYYKRLVAPQKAVDQKDLEEITLDIRPEFEDVIVLYCVYFYYQRALKEDQKVETAMNNYKYLVEDLLHELAAEDVFNSEDIIIRYEE